METIKKNKGYLAVLAILTVIAVVFGGYKTFYPNTPSEEKTYITSSQSSETSQTSQTSQSTTSESLASWETDTNYIPPSTSTVESTVEVSVSSEEQIVSSAPKEEVIIVKDMSIGEAASIALSLTGGGKVMLDEEDEYVYIFGVFSDEETHMSRLGTVYVNKNYSGAEFVEN